MTVWIYTRNSNESYHCNFSRYKVANAGSTYTSVDGNTHNNKKEWIHSCLQMMADAVFHYIVGEELSFIRKRYYLKYRCMHFFNFM